MEANEYPGPAVVNVYTTCQPEHGVGDNMAAAAGRLAVDSRAFPLLRLRSPEGRADRRAAVAPGQPQLEGGLVRRPARPGKLVDFVTFARTEGRFARQFDAEGRPSPALLAGQADRLANWRLLQELSGLR